MNFSIKKLIVGIIIIAVASVGSVVAYSSYMKNKDIVKTELFPIEAPILVNLQEDKILKTSITLEYTGKKGLEVITGDISKISDCVINSLSGKKTTDIDSTEERNNAKKELTESINRALGKKHIVNVLFTEFIIS